MSGMHIKDIDLNLLRLFDAVYRTRNVSRAAELLDLTQPAASQGLTRLQRQLSASLFMHDGREVFVTFSAGVTSFRDGEALDTALERADRALYEAKRSGKNRTCVA